MIKLVLVRHGESEWNKLNLFTGWTDVELSDKGREEAKLAGKLLKDEGYDFDICFTSYLKRAIHTLNGILCEISNGSIASIRPSAISREPSKGTLLYLTSKSDISEYLSL